MASVAFIGLGNMGGPMAANLVKAGHRVVGFDMVEGNLSRAAEAGVEPADSAAAAAAAADCIVTMLPAGPHVRAVYMGDGGGEGGVIAAARPGALLVDCSTIDVDSARAVNRAAAEKGFEMVDAPVSGGVGGASAATLTFMVGGEEQAFARAEPVLAAMGKTIVHTGGPGTGQAAKICNNMILGISMIAVSEAFALAERLGLDAQKLFDVASRSSGQCWSLTTYCPVPGPVPNSPANRDYAPGFTADMMLKDLRLAQQTAHASGAATPLGAEAAALYALFSNAGHGAKDFSGIIRMLAGKA
ncbi:3-hydroxyisobutyrate dehydrogenase [Arenibaculum pallidiluteum]|uniref:3-hydroxyisobutyrate dehydrogenase n=1 Tax=Arenibaculum pallidiluteum TaxID=2812559 RepID=UPI001A96E273|nr:3-hydroxyisobutyrate dehydrogenase [Arenibaculum pallidiluteum]